MVEATAFRQVLLFLDKIGVYDVILPFLLVFTIVFAILEKSKILGLEKIDGKEVTKKNLNSMVAFVVAFLVIASTQLVAVISKVMADVVLLLILAICFLMLVGVFFSDKQFTLEQYPTWTKFFMIFMFIGIVLIFLNALDWLKFVLALFEDVNTDILISLLFVTVIGGFMWFVVHEPAKKA